MDVGRVRQDLIDEQEALDAALAGLDAAAWSTPTASPRWTVADQIAHLAYFDRAAAVAIADPHAFTGMRKALADTLPQGDEAVDQLTLGAYRGLPRDALVDAWRRDRDELAMASAQLTDDDRVEWYGPSMGSKSFLTARLMECWAHGTDATEAVDRTMPPTERLIHIARLGFITRGWSYVNRGLDAPTTTVSVRLTSPAGESWTFGDDAAEESVVGSALDFCRVVTQRRHLDDTALVVTPAAREWLLIAQAFAGPATDGPAPRD